MCNLCESKLETLGAANFQGMEIHSQEKFVRKLGKSCGVKVWKLVDYFEGTECIILRILDWRLSLLAGATSPRHFPSKSFLSSKAFSSTASRIFLSPSRLMPRQDTKFQQYCLMQPNLQFIVTTFCYHVTSPLRMSIQVWGNERVKECHLDPIWNMHWGQTNNLISSIM